MVKERRSSALGTHAPGNPKKTNIYHTACVGLNDFYIIDVLLNSLGFLPPWVTIFRTSGHSPVCYVTVRTVGVGLVG